MLRDLPMPSDVVITQSVFKAQLAQLLRPICNEKEFIFLFFRQLDSLEKIYNRTIKRVHDTLKILEQNIYFHAINCQKAVLCTSRKT